MLSHETSPLHRSSGLDRRKCVVGLIGGIGSGKSRVAYDLAQRGAAVIKADELGHQALRQSVVTGALRQRWGPDIFDNHGDIDRGKVAALVFADPAERQALERIVFPYIEQGIDARIAQAKLDPSVRFVVLDAAIMLETGWSQRCDWIVYVHAPRAQRLERLSRQRGWNEKEVRCRSRAQLPLTEKASHAHFVLDNSGSAEELTQQIDRLVASLLLSNCPVS
jgi:dephospho-CoA kinase